jgi:hypothetical protein
MADNIRAVTVGTVEEWENHDATRSRSGYSVSETLRESSTSTPLRHLPRLLAATKRLFALFAVGLLVVASLATRLVLRGGKQAPTLLQRGATLSGLPLVPFRRHDLAVFILNPVLCARRKLFEGPLERRSLLHGGVPRPFIGHGLYGAVFSTTDTKSHRFLLFPCCCTPARYSRDSTTTGADAVSGAWSVR